MVYRMSAGAGGSEECEVIICEVTMDESIHSRMQGPLLVISVLHNGSPVMD